MEAPTSASILLAGVLLKVGVYGVIKIVVLINTPVFVVTVLSLFGMVVISIATSMSRERKVITANSRVTHMNLALYGINLISNVGMRGSYLLRLSHGFVSSIMFAIVGMMYNIRGTRILYYITGASA